MKAKAIAFTLISASGIFFRSAIASTSVTLAWDASSGSAAGYKVYCLDGASTQPVISDVGDVTTAVVGNLIAGRSYEFYTTAYDTKGAESDPSNHVSFTPTSSTNQSRFLRSDTTTLGNWIGVYGDDGYFIPGSSQNSPQYLDFSSSADQWIWTSEPKVENALRVAGASNNRIASCWYSSTSMNFEFPVSDGNMHVLSMYFWDAWSSGREEVVDLIDTESGATLDSRLLRDFKSGVYLVWQVTGKVRIRISCSSGVNAVVSGIFFDSPTSKVKFVQIDSTTQGNWNTGYGIDGSIIAKDNARLPAYAQVNVSGQSEWRYSTDTPDRRALWKNDGTGRVAGVWYSYYPTTNAFFVNVKILDAGTHRLSVYALDWYNQGRSLQIDVLDPTTAQILDTQQLQNYWSGQYLVWDIKGSVQLRVSTLAGPNALLSGIFLDPSSTAL
jgi:hypothetical protein